MGSIIASEVRNAQVCDSPHAYSFLHSRFPGNPVAEIVNGCCQKQDVQDGEDFRDYRVSAKGDVSGSVNDMALLDRVEVQAVSLQG